MSRGCGGGCADGSGPPPGGAGQPLRRGRAGLGWATRRFSRPRVGMTSLPSNPAAAPRILSPPRRPRYAPVNMRAAPPPLSFRTRTPHPAPRVSQTLAAGLPLEPTSKPLPPAVHAIFIHRAQGGRQMRLQPGYVLIHQHLFSENRHAKFCTKFQFRLIDRKSVIVLHIWVKELKRKFIWSYCR